PPEVAGRGGAVPGHLRGDAEAGGGRGAQGAGDLLRVVRERDRRRALVHGRVPGRARLVPARLARADDPAAGLALKAFDGYGHHGILPERGRRRRPHGVTPATEGGTRRRTVPPPRLRPL